MTLQDATRGSSVPPAEQPSPTCRVPCASTTPNESGLYDWQKGAHICRQLGQNIHPLPDDTVYGCGHTESGSCGVLVLAPLACRPSRRPSPQARSPDFYDGTSRSPPSHV